MELKEYLTIFRKYFKLFITVAALFVVAGILFQLFRPLNYKAVLNLNVTRIGFQETSDYRYDDFYRLQADEKFADTVVRWLGSPRMGIEIYNDSKIVSTGLSQGKLSKIFKAQRVSSQVVSVKYFSKTPDSARDLSKSIIKIVNREAENLNKFQKEEAWFTVMGGEPVIGENKWPWGVVILASLLLGIFVGVWTVLIKHYLSLEN